ncbi:uncharacterized protein si:dkey-245f22.3 isoform X1 [Takifugu flavidus]|uniref:uncharacterized protein si:dkey-245f22.3 isoform X1 n=1 Tax=Takifugu flavidus TaxID=433684 RepID=UPI002543FC57|nr:uncharacterized protein si:dkey-245f22.3 isoform X1 [Takifugu flavidus]
MDTVPNSEDEFSSLTIASNVSLTPNDPVMAHPTGTGISVEMNKTCGTTRAASVCSSASVVPDKTAPRPGARPPSPTEVGASGEESPSLTSVSRKAESFKSTTADTEPDSEGVSRFLSENFALRFCWPASSANLWTAYWPRSEGATAGSALFAPRRAAASPAACSPSWGSATSVTRAGAWALTAAPSVTSAGRPQSAWTSAWKFPKCFTTNEQNVTPTQGL